MMLRWMQRTRDDERGIALVTAVLISAVVMVLGATAVGISLHNTEQSARDRRRVESIGAAEAGLDYYYSHLQDVSPVDIECQIAKSLTGTPTAAFVVRGEYYDDTGALIPCPMTDNVIPDSVLITSKGTTSQVDPTRTMQSYAYLIPKPPKPFGASAIFSDGNPEFNSNVTVFGGGQINADIYTNGDIILESNVVAEGSVYAQGSATIRGNAEIKRDVWAGGSVSLENQSVVRGDVTASTGSIAITQSGHIYGDAQAATTISAGAGAIDGLRIENTPYDPPPQRPFPEYVYDAQDWVDAGYTVTTFSDCASARAYIQGIASGDHTVRITVPCDLQVPSNDTVTVRGNLAIISEGSLVMNSNTRFVSDGNEHNLFLIFGLGGVEPCDITFRSNSDVGDDLTTLFYTPCTIDMSSNSFTAKGQMFGGNVEFNSNATLTFELIPVPGLAPDGFDEDITFIREVITEPDPL